MNRVFPITLSLLVLAGGTTLEIAPRSASVLAGGRTSGTKSGSGNVLTRITSGSGWEADNQKVTGAVAATGGNSRPPMSSRNLM